MIVFSFFLLQFSSPRLFTSLWYSSPCLLVSSISLCLSLFQLYLCLVDITLPILVTVIFSFTWSYSTCSDSFASLCRNLRHNYPCLFTSSWSSSLFLFASSIPLHISLSKLSLRLVDITSPKFVTIVFYASKFGRKWSGRNCKEKFSHVWSLGTRNKFSHVWSLCTRNKIGYELLVSKSSKLGSKIWPLRKRP